MASLKLKRFPAIVVGLLLLVGALIPSVGSRLSAQTPGQGLEISPPLIERQVDPGDKVTLKIRLRNITRDTLVTNSTINDFTASGEEGQPKLLLEEVPGEPSPYSLKPWVHPIPSMTLVAQEAKSVNVSVTVPKDASPGGHYGVVRFTATPPGLEDTGVSLSASIGTLVLLRVSGDVSEKLEFAEFFAMAHGRRGSFFESGPVTFTERMKNSGNVHVKPSGEVRVTNMFGKEVAKLAVNDKAGNILPASIRKFDQTLNKSMFGRYTAQATLIYGADNKQIIQSLHFWIIPYKLILLILGSLVVIFLILRWALRGYKKRILAQTQPKAKPKTKTRAKK